MITALPADRASAITCWHSRAVTTPFGVVGDHDGPGMLDLARALREQPRLGRAVDAGRRFVVDAKQLLPLSERPAPCASSTVRRRIAISRIPRVSHGLRELASGVVVAR